MTSLPRYTPIDQEAGPPNYYDDDYDPDYKYNFENPKEPIPAPDYEGAFQIETPKYNDPLFTWVFISTLAGFAYLTWSSWSVLKPGDVIMVLSDDDNNNEVMTTWKLSKGAKALYSLIMISICVPLITSLSTLLLAYSFPVVFIYLGFLFGPIIMFSLALTSFMSGAILPGILFAFFGAMLLSFMFNSYNRFSYSSILLKLVMDGVYQYPSTILISIISSIVTSFSSIIYFSSFLIIMFARNNIDDSSCPHSDGNDICVSNKTTTIFIYALFTGFFLFEVIKNTNHVTLSGVFGTWYFFGTKPAVVSRPSNPAWGSFKRAITYCFGSICFGSLIVSFISTLRTCLTLVKQKLYGTINNDNSNPGNDLIICALICFVRIMEWFVSEMEYWVKWFNRYAYSYLAIYGKSYLVSARDTFEIMKYKGIDILITDSLINSAMSLYSLLSLILTGIGIFISYKLGFGGINEMSNEMLIIGSIGSLLIAWFISTTTMNVIDVGACTTIIGLAIDPDSFIEGREEIWIEMCKHYPNIQERVKVEWPENN